MPDLKDLENYRGRLERSGFAERVAALVRIASDRRDDLSEIHLLCSLASVDMPAFLEAMRSCVASDPRNVSALQALLWGARRQSRHEEARATIVKMLALHPADRGLALDLLRSELVAPGSDSDRWIDECMAVIDDPLARCSYAYQAGMRLPHRARPHHRHDLLSEIRKIAHRIEVRNTGNSPAQGDGADSVWVDACRRVARARSIAIVGNGSSLIGKGYGPSIDASDLVVRINFPILRGHEADVGGRADLVAFSEGLLARLPAFVDRDAVYRSLPLLAVSPFPAVGPAHADPTSSGLRLGRVPSHVSESLTAFSYDLATTGCLVLCLCVFLAHTGADVDVYGFDFYQDRAHPHYFAGHDQVFLGHDLAYERFLVEEIVPDLR